MHVVHIMYIVALTFGILARINPYYLDLATNIDYPSIPF